MQTRQIEAFGRKVTTTATHLIRPINDNTSNAYQSAMSEIHRELRRPGLQRSVFSFVQSSPTELMRARLSRSEIEHRAVTYIPDELLESIPEDDNAFSLYQGFQAILPETGEREHRKKHRRQLSRGRKLLDNEKAVKESPGLEKLTRERDKASHKLEMMGIRKNMCSAEILEIDKKIANLYHMRKIVLDRLSDLEDGEVNVEQEVLELDGKVEDMRELLEEEVQVAKLPTPSADSKEGADDDQDDNGHDTPTGSSTFMSQSIYEKLPSPKAKRHKPSRRRSMPVRHEHFEPGTNIRVIPAHNDLITTLDFDAPFGTMVTAALDDTVRVWDLNHGRCLGLLDGHRASVRCLQVEDHLVATGSIDASIRLWDLSLAEYPASTISTTISKPADADDEEEREGQEGPEDCRHATTTPLSPDPSRSVARSSSSMANTHVLSLEAHVSEITALHFHKDTLVSGSADKTLRQWDLVKGRCVQTLDVLWAAAQAASTSLNQSSSSSSLSPFATGRDGGSGWRTTSRLPDASVDFVGAVQCFDAALACGTADGMVRLWDLRSGQVHRSLVGHTGPVTSLQFDDVHMVTGSLDRSIRVSCFWSIFA